MNKKRLLLGLGLAATGAAILAQFLPAGAPAPSEVRSERGRAMDRAREASARFDALPGRQALGKLRGQLFGPGSWAPAAPAQRPVAQIPEKPAPPPIPYRVAGEVVVGDGLRVVLSRGDRIFQVREGETLDGGYRVESIAPHAVKLVYLPLGVTQELQVAGVGLDLAPGSLASASSPSPPASPPPAPAATQPAQEAGSSVAQLRFEGPQQVHTGTPFDVALKLTSTQPVRAMPMQLSFDAKRLEPLAVRAGDLFAGGSFTYRVSPNGSIFVGASGNGRAAADANFLVVTFRPIASGPAELRVSSLLVEGASGRTIVHEPPEAFRAAIVQ